MTALFATYRRLPRLAGPWFLPIAFLARLPFSMTQIGTVVLVTAETGSVAAGGLAAGLLSAGLAIGGPTLGWLTGRWGQRIVMGAASLLAATLSITLVVLVTTGAPLVLVGAAAFFGGAMTPPIGPLIRVRWVGLTARDGGLPTAMSYEGAADEVAYVLGPALVSVLAALVHPVAAVLTAAVLIGVFGTLVALHPTADAAPARSARPAGRRFRIDATVIGVVVGGLAMGAFFGSMQTGVTGVARAAGDESAAGLIYACMAIGSAVTALAMAVAPSRWSLADRLLAFTAALTLLIVPLFTVSHPAVLAVWLVPLGCASGPLLITLFSLAERSADPSRVAVAMTTLSSSVVVGYAVGSALGGRMVEDVAPSAAFGVAVAVAALGTANALLLRRTATRTAGPS
ncbi:MFS transporter [Nakamurella leprariae]|uniref:MFS transporter n=1 Tax=Nakamurella leprariae TaxID=2803911 RepID=A0A938Y575_9ACTN|nr:MFS transporter [Nakamurella leprariae]MBM9465990.1 hypothetical protein [Nakamurella leprariae]